MRGHDKEVLVEEEMLVLDDAAACGCMIQASRVVPRATTRDGMTLARSTLQMS